MNIPKQQIYQMWTARGEYLGVLQGVSSKFKRIQDINSIGTSRIIISVSMKYDTASEPVKAILTEDGKWITTESGIGLTTEGEQPNFGVDKSKIRNGNIIKITEVSDYHPNGIVVFNGKVKRWKVNFGTDDDGLLYVTPLGADLNNYIVRGPDVVVYSQLTQNGSFVLENLPGSRRAVRPSTLFFSGSTAGIQSIKVKLAANSSLNPANVVLKVFDVAGGVTIDSAPTASATISVTSTTPTDYTFNLPFKINGQPYGGDKFIWFTFESDNTAFIYKNSPRITTPGVAPWMEIGLYNNGDIPYSTNYNDELYMEASYVTDATKSTFINMDPSNILKFAMDKYKLEGGIVTYTPSSIDVTGIIIPTYTFQVETIARALETILDLSPPGFYYFVDPGTNVLYFKRVNTVADHVLIFKDHIQNLDLSASIENLKNNVLLTGGLVGSNNLFLERVSEASVTNFGKELDIINDINVVDASTGNSIANNYLDKVDDEVFETQVSIVDGTADITSYQLGETIGFAGFGNMADNVIIPIVRISRDMDILDADLGALPARQTDRIKDSQEDILAIQTVANPNQPS